MHAEYEAAAYEQIIRDLNSSQSRSPEANEVPANTLAQMPEHSLMHCAAA